MSQLISHSVELKLGMVVPDSHPQLISMPAGDVILNEILDYVIYVV